MFGNEITNLYRGLVIDGSYLVSVYLTKRFQRRNIYWNWPTRNKSCLLRPCLLTDRDEMSNLYRGPSINASYQVSVDLAKRFQRRRFLKKSANQKQELPMAVMFVNGSGRNEQSLYRTYQISDQLALWFQRRRLKCEKLTDDGRQLMAKAHFAFGKVS